VEWTCNEVSPVLVVSLSMIYDVPYKNLHSCSTLQYVPREFIGTLNL